MQAGKITGKVLYRLKPEPSGTYRLEVLTLRLEAGELESFWDLDIQGAWSFSLPQRTKLRAVPLVEMISISGGSFRMGRPEGEKDEVPVHKVTLKGYFLGRTEVTQRQRRVVMGTRPSLFAGDERPVEQISWFDALEFCNRLSLMENLTPVYDLNGEAVTVNWAAEGYRLPTEAEWEYAARVRRGGSWISPEDQGRVSFRFSERPGEKMSFTGLRVARSLAPAPVPAPAARPPAQPAPAADPRQAPSRAHQRTAPAEPPRR